MKKTQKQFVVSWMLLMVMIMNLFPIGTVYAADIPASVLTGLTASVIQDGSAIPQGGTITSIEPIRVNISFGVPVSGDDPTPTDPVQKGDTVSIDVSDAFTVVSGAPIELKMGSILVGHATFSTDPDTNMVTATVTFDGDDEVFDGTYNTVTVEFGGDFNYDASGDAGNAGDYTVAILEKTYTVNVPALPIVYDVEKTGTANLADQSITWTINVEATQGSANIDLAGYRFIDNLQTVGAYIPDSFQVDGVGLTPDFADNVLSYGFPDSSISPKTVTFKTAIADSSYYAASQQKISNKAQLQNSELTVVDEGQFEVSFTPKWIAKAGASSDAGSTGIYDPTNRTITWTITANQMGATLNNVVITDVLPNGLSFQSAGWQSWNGSDWNTSTSITPNANGEYTIGDINAMILLTIVTSVPDDQYTTGRSTYSNSATIRWDGLPGSGLGSGSVSVGVGYNAISKSGVANPLNQKVRWTVNVDTRGQSIPELKVYDLLVYGNSITLSTVSGIPADVLNSNLTPQYGQKYAGNFSGSYTVSVIPILQGGVRVADLLEITGLSTSATNVFSFDSQVLNPNIFAGNTTSTLRNTATLFSASSRLNAATGSVSYTNRMLRKEMLKREAMPDPAAGVNTQRTSTVSEGFDYQDKSVIFRLNVNADGINLTNATNAAGLTLGAATLTDTLPAGWEFIDIVPGLKHLIFEGTGSGSTVSATDTTPDTVLGLVEDFSMDGTATFTFTTLDKPYVILVKAKPTSETAAAYFDSNETTTVRNNVSLKTENWTTGVNHYQDVTIISQILEKSTTQPKAGELLWTVEYKPYDIGQTGEKLEDQIPLGIDLRTDASGNLIIPGNISVYELTLNADGSHTLGNSVDLVPGTNLSYNNATRVLSFIFPDNQKAYRFSYLTDITGEPGTISNKVLLIGADTDLEETSKVYLISASDGSASLLKNGWITITKTNGQSPLAGAEFTLYALDGTTVIKKGITGINGTVKLKVIPDGKYILRETAAPAGYKLEGVDHSLVVATNGSTVTASIDGKTGANANTIIVQNYIEGTAGNLTISKTATGNGADTTKAFDFTLTLGGATGTYSYIGHGLTGGTITSGDTISLTHGQSITITGLPAGATYSVAEADYADDGYTTASTGATGSIVADETQTASFTNIRTVGNLTISKTVAGNAGDFDKKFDFTLTLNGNGADRAYSYTGNGVKDGIIKSGDTFSLAHGQSITITGLPAEATYSVTEADYAGDGYTKTSTGEAGSILTDNTKTAAFTNTKNRSSSSPDTGNLTISKTVSGISADRTQKFLFTVTFSGATGSYQYTGNGIPNGIIKSGDTVSIAHGQSITITGLPAGTAYQVKEEEKTAVGYSVESAGSTGTIYSSQNHVAAFTNTIKPISSGSLIINKNVTGQGADLAKKFDFTVTFIGAPDVYPYSGVAIGTIRSGGTISLADGESITITGLPIGTQYAVTEVDYTDAGYTATSTGATGTIATGMLQTATFTNNHGNINGTPVTPGENLGDGSVPQGNSNIGDDGMPKTGDNQTNDFTKFWLLFFSIAFIVLYILDSALRKKHFIQGHRR